MEQQSSETAIKALRRHVKGLQDDYMSDDMQAAFKTYFEARRQELQTLIQEGLQRTRDAGGANAPCAIDRSQSQQEQEEENRLQDNRNAELREIANAMSHLDSGECGYCKDCGDEIGLGRMLAVPSSLRDIHCEDLRRG